MHESELQDIEIELFIRALKLRYGYDFSQYAPASFKRRVQSLLMHAKVARVSQLTDRLLHDEGFLPEVISRLSVPVSEMFRNPEAFRALAADVFPVLASHPRINIWQAGCANGEEVYSLAILLSEAGLYERARIYATDISPAALARAQEAIYPARDAKLYSENYLRAGGSGSLSDYFHADYGHVKLDEKLKRNVTFAQHNLAADGVFVEAQLILCRNVLIYFREPLQARVLTLFRDSLARGGFLCLGNKEMLELSPVAADFRRVETGVALYRRLGHGGG